MWIHFLSLLFAYAICVKCEMERLFLSFLLHRPLFITNFSFDNFKLAQPLQKAITKLGFEFCTPIQAQSLVHTLEGHDVTGRAQTGTGKTVAFLVTIINDLLTNTIESRYIAEPRALVVAPTRELAIQIASDASGLTEFCDIHVVTLVGGEDYKKQLTVSVKKIKFLNLFFLS